MRRIYDSEALERDDDEPHAPRERRRRSYAPRAIRSVNLGGLAGRLLPRRLRRRAIRVDVTTPREAYEAGEPVPFSVELHNVLPISLAVRTPTPVAWTWSVDGHVEASHVRQWNPPEEPGALAFGRGERKRFEREWNGLFRVAADEWEPAEPGEHVLGVAVGPDVGGVCDRGAGRDSVRDDGRNSACDDEGSALDDGSPAHDGDVAGRDAVTAPELAASTTVRVVRE